ncbi:MAG: VOC family protein [Euryarchaeota archaeon]|nr:VOC family protein [Euryarchaeota archaeon]
MAMALKKPVGVNVMLGVENVEKTAHFWEENFGAKIRDQMKAPDGTWVHAGTKFGESYIMWATISQPGSMKKEDWQAWSAKPRYNGVNVYVNVKNVTKVWETAKANGAEIREPLTDQFWGDRNFTCVDNNGILVTFAEKVKNVTAKQMAKALKESGRPQ